MPDEKANGLYETTASSGGPHTALQVDKGATANPASHSFPWRGGPLDTLKKALLTVHFQASIQLAAGTFIVALFSFVADLRFDRSCLASIFLVVGMILVAPNAHVGSRLAGASIIIGSLWFGALVGACAISLARAPHVAYTTFLVLFVALGLLVTTTLRVKANIGVGIISNLGFGILLISGQFAWPAVRLWRHTYTAILRLSLVAALGVVAAGLLVLPSLAGDDVRAQLATILADLGVVVSNGASHLLLRSEDGDRLTEDGDKADHVEKAASARAFVLRTLEEARDDAEIGHVTQPGVQLRPRWMQQRHCPTLAGLRTRVAQCREVFRMVCDLPPYPPS